MSYAIPDYFHEAAAIFLAEVEDHLRYLDGVLAESEANPACLVENAKAIAERFHLIRGGSGFLNLAPVLECATAGERLFRGEIPSDSAGALQRTGSELRNLLTILHREVPEVRSAIGGR